MKRLLAFLLLLPAVAGAADRPLPLGFRMRLRPMFDVVPSGGTAVSSGGGSGSPTGNDQLFIIGASSATGGSLMFNTTQTPDAPMLLTGTLSNSWIIAEAADRTFDFAHAAATDPSLFIQSHNQSTTEWFSLSHGGTDVTLHNGVNAGKFLFATNAINRVGINSSGLLLPTLAYVGWSSNNLPTGTINTFLSNQTGGTAGVIQMGQDVNGAAVNQTFKAHNGITGTDILGAGLTLSGGIGTGAAASNPLVLNRQITKATGTTVQTFAPAVIVCPSKILSNTSATTTTVATITTTTTSGGSATIDYGTLACSGATCDADGAIAKVAWNNNAGTVAAALTAVVLQADSDATGTTTTGATVTVATNVVSLKVTPVFVTIVPTSVIFTAMFTVHSALDTVVCQ